MLKYQGERRVSSEQSKEKQKAGLEISTYGITLPERIEAPPPRFVSSSVGSLDCRLNSSVSGDVVFLRGDSIKDAIKEADVERINQFSFYQLGSALRSMATYAGETSPHTVVWDLWRAQRQIDELIDGKPIPLGVCRTAAKSLKEAMDYTDESHFREKDEKGNMKVFVPASDAPKIPPWEFVAIKDALTKFETVFSAEMGEATTYFVPRRGIFYTPDLVDKADNSFPESIRGHIPDKARVDWRSAGRCLAFNLLSASGFHVARAVEGTLELYYQLFSGNSGATLKTWNDYHQALIKIAATKPTPAPAEKTLAEFVQMKDDYRNPIMHPRIMLTESDARMLFDNGESLIIAMAEEIKAIREKSGIQTALSVIANSNAP
jgi:hypothetical protein